MPLPTNRTRPAGPSEQLTILLVLLLVLLLPLTLGIPQETSAQTTKPSVTPDTPTSLPIGLVTRDESGALRWPRPRTDEREKDRLRMVATQIAGADAYREAITDERVLAALRAVPRHAFVPRSQQRQAYADTPLPIGHGQTISQPYIVALMTDYLDVQPGDRVLEIGTGSGYQAAVLSELTPDVFTIEIIEPLYRTATAKLKELGHATIRTRLADGYDGWPQYAPFDGIIVTCAAGHVPPPLWEQLKPGGRMVIPVGSVYETQRLVVLTKQPDGSRESRTIIPVRFVPMTGKMQSK